MMKRKRSVGLSKVKILLVIPLILLLVVGFASARNNDSLSQIPVEKLNVQIEENPDNPPELVKYPKLTIENCRDILPESVTNAKEDISLTVRIVVGTDGQPLLVQVMEEMPSGYNAESFAIEFFKRCTYKAAQKDGKAVVATLEDIILLK